MNRSKWSRQNQNVITGNEYELLGWMKQLCLVSDIFFHRKKKVSLNDLRLSFCPTTEKALTDHFSLQLSTEKKEM
jgi:hypothetical protein